MNPPPTAALLGMAPTSTAPTPHIAFDNTYARLPEHFYARTNPRPVANPRLLKLNTALAKQLGLDPEALASPAGLAILAGNQVAAGSEPLALAYAGHQFGHFVPQLGDGRANLLGEVVARDGRRFDLQLKGSGPTPFSRRGDGRAALGPVLREYVVSEAMAALGVPSTRALAAVLTGERVLRETSLPGAVLTRVASSHLRVGTFEYFAGHEDIAALRTLALYALRRHYPEAARAAKPFHALLAGVIGRQARLIAQWRLLGFVHGVMNTDNMAISGETIDYGPCAFLETYDPTTVFSSIDQFGRYSYANQPHAAQWNLARLAESLLPLLAEEAGGEEAAIASATATLASFETQHEAAHTAGLRQKIGLHTEQAGDTGLCLDLLDRMAANRVDFTLFFRRLCDAAASPEADRTVRALFTDPNSYDAWAARWRARLAAEPTSPEARAASMRRLNPAYIPRNHLVQAVIDAAVQRDDFEPFDQLLQAVTQPYDERPGCERYSAPALPQELVERTFCGT